MNVDIKRNTLKLYHSVVKFYYKGKKEEKTKGFFLKKKINYMPQ